MSAPSDHSHLLPLARTMTSPSAPSPPPSAAYKVTSSSSRQPLQDNATHSSIATSEPKKKDAEKLAASPKPPELAVPPSNSSAQLPTHEAPAQLALMLSNALAEIDALKKGFSEEQRRAARAERILQTFHPGSSIDKAVSDEQKIDKVPEGSLKAVLEAEARAERAERARDDALHALNSLSTHFAELERYESSLSLRAADARSAFTRLLSTVTASHPPPTSSPTLSDSAPALGLPGPPPPLPTPSLAPLASHYLNHTGAPPPSSSTRYPRGLPSYITPSIGYPSSAHSHGAGHVRQSSLTNNSAFSSLPLPPPPSASGLGSGLIGALSAPPPSSSSSFSVPVKRSQRNRSTRGPDEGTTEFGTWEESKRRRIGNWDMDVDEQPLTYPHRQSPLSAQPTQRMFEPERNRLQHQQSYTRNGAQRNEEHRETNGSAPLSANGMVRLDARELVRDAKERERREKSIHYRSRDGETTKRSRRSASRSSARSSRSIDEMLLETATDGDYERKEDGRSSPLDPRHEQQGLGQYPSHAHAQAMTALPPASSSSQYRDHASPLVSLLREKVLVVASHTGQSTSTAAPANGAVEREKSVKVPATNLVTLGPDGVVVSGGGHTAPAPIPGGGFPAYNEAGQRICRQCGAPGRYKEGKCVEKWGPGPEGPGTVCDRCRKKMKRVERRGTLDGSAATVQQQAFLAQRQSQSQLSAQPTLPLGSSHSQSQSRTSMRSDTLTLDPTVQNQLQPKRLHLNAQNREEGSRVSLKGERLMDEGHRADSSRHSSPGLCQSQGQRRAPMPPFITSITTREQDNNGDGDGDGGEDVDEDEEGGNCELDVDAELASAAEVADGRKSASRSTATYSSSSSNGSIAVPNGSPQKPRSSSRASSASTTTAYERDGPRNALNRLPNGAVSSKRIPLPSIATLARSTTGREIHDEDYADDDIDAEADGSGDTDADAEIMDAVDASMKVEE